MQKYKVLNGKSGDTRVGIRNFFFQSRQNGCHMNRNSLEFNPNNISGSLRPSKARKKANFGIYKASCLFQIVR